VIRILQVMEATTGGTRRHLRHIAEHLDRTRFELTFACSSLRDPRFLDDVASFRQAGLVVLDVPMQREMQPLADLKAFLRLCRVVWANDVDIIHTHSSKAGVLGRLAGKLCSRAKILHTPHCFSFLHKSEFGGVKHGLFVACERLLGLLTDRLIVVSSEERDAAVYHRIVSPERISLLHNGVAAGQAPDLHRGERLLGEMGVAPGATLIGSAGLLTQAKGYAHLIDALPVVMKQFPDLYCVIIGHGELESDLRERAQRAGLASRVVFSGYVERCEDLVAALDVFVLPSLWEGLPYAVLEAMAVGTPVVASRVGGCVEIVQHGETGLLVEPGDAAGLGEAIATLLRDPAQRERMGQKGRERVRELFGLERMITGLEGLYQELAGAADGARVPSAQVDA
jgi:glycosyltransferase involved in cell wall biosynthesis